MLKYMNIRVFLLLSLFFLKTYASVYVLTEQLIKDQTSIGKSYSHVTFEDGVELSGEVFPNLECFEPLDLYFLEHMKTICGIFRNFKSVYGLTTDTVEFCEDFSITTSVYQNWTISVLSSVYPVSLPTFTLHVDQLNITGTKVIVNQLLLFDEAFFKNAFITAQGVFAYNQLMIEETLVGNELTVPITILPGGTLKMYGQAETLSIQFLLHTGATVDGILTTQHHVFVSNHVKCTEGSIVTASHIIKKDFDLYNEDFGLINTYFVGYEFPEWCFAQTDIGLDEHIAGFEDEAKKALVSREGNTISFGDRIFEKAVPKTVEHKRYVPNLNINNATDIFIDTVYAGDFTAIGSYIIVEGLECDSLTLIETPLRFRKADGTASTLKIATIFETDGVIHLENDVIIDGNAQLGTIVWGYGHKLTVNGVCYVNNSIVLHELTLMCSSIVRTENSNRFIHFELEYHTLLQTQSIDLGVFSLFSTDLLSVLEAQLCHISNSTTLYSANLVCKNLFVKGGAVTDGVAARNLTFSDFHFDMEECPKFIQKTTGNLTFAGDTDSYNREIILSQYLAYYVQHYRGAIVRTHTNLRQAITIVNCVFDDLLINTNHEVKIMDSTITKLTLMTNMRVRTSGDVKVGAITMYHGSRITGDTIHIELLTIDRDITMGPFNLAVYDKIHSSGNHVLTIIDGRHIATVIDMGSPFGIDGSGIFSPEMIINNGSCSSCLLSVEAVLQTPIIQLKSILLYVNITASIEKITIQYSQVTCAGFCEFGSVHIREGGSVRVMSNSETDDAMLQINDLLDIDSVNGGFASSSYVIYIASSGTAYFGGTVRVGVDAYIYIGNALIITGTVYNSTDCHLFLNFYCAVYRFFALSVPSNTVGLADECSTVEQQRRMYFPSRPDRGFYPTPTGFSSFKFTNRKITNPGKFPETNYAYIVMPDTDLIMDHSNHKDYPTMIIVALPGVTISISGEFLIERCYEYRYFVCPNGNIEVNSGFSLTQQKHISTCTNQYFYFLGTVTTNFVTARMEHLKLFIFNGVMDFHTTMSWPMTLTNSKHIGGPSAVIKSTNDAALSGFLFDDKITFIKTDNAFLVVPNADATINLAAIPEMENGAYTLPDCPKLMRYATDEPILIRMESSCAIRGQFPERYLSHTTITSDGVVHIDALSLSALSIQSYGIIIHNQLLSSKTEQSDMTKLEAQYLHVAYGATAKFNLLRMDFTVKETTVDVGGMLIFTGGEGNKASNGLYFKLYMVYNVELYVYGEIKFLLLGSTSIAVFAFPELGVDASECTLHQHIYGKYTVGDATTFLPTSRSVMHVYPSATLILNEGIILVDDTFTSLETRMAFMCQPWRYMWTKKIAHTDFWNDLEWSVIFSTECHRSELIVEWYDGFESSSRNFRGADKFPRFASLVSTRNTWHLFENPSGRFSCENCLFYQETVSYVADTTVDNPNKPVKAISGAKITSASTTVTHTATRGSIQYIGTSSNAEVVDKSSGQVGEIIIEMSDTSYAKFVKLEAFVSYEHESMLLSINSHIEFYIPSDADIIKSRIHVMNNGWLSLYSAQTEAIISDISIIVREGGTINFRETTIILDSENSLYLYPKSTLDFSAVSMCVYMMFKYDHDIDIVITAKLLQNSCNPKLEFQSDSKSITINSQRPIPLTIDLLGVSHSISIGSCEIIDVNINSFESAQLTLFIHGRKPNLLGQNIPTSFHLRSGMEVCSFDNSVAADVFSGQFDVESIWYEDQPGMCIGENVPIDIVCVNVLPCSESQTIVFKKNLVLYRDMDPDMPSIFNLMWTTAASTNIYVHGVELSAPKPVIADTIHFSNIKLVFQNSQSYLDCGDYIASNVFLTYEQYQADDCPVQASRSAVIHGPQQYFASVSAALRVKTPYVLIYDCPDPILIDFPSIVRAGKASIEYTDTHAVDLHVYGPLSIHGPAKTSAKIYCAQCVPHLQTETQLLVRSAGDIELNSSANTDNVVFSSPMSFHSISDDRVLNVSDGMFFASQTNVNFTLSRALLNMHTYAEGVAFVDSKNSTFVVYNTSSEPYITPLNEDTQSVIGYSILKHNEWRYLDPADMQLALSFKSCAVTEFAFSHQPQSVICVGDSLTDQMLVWIELNCGVPQLVPFTVINRTAVVLEYPSHIGHGNLFIQTDGINGPVLDTFMHPPSLIIKTGDTVWEGDVISITAEFDLQGGSCPSYEMKLDDITFSLLQNELVFEVPVVYGYDRTLSLSVDGVVVHQEGIDVRPPSVVAVAFLSYDVIMTLSFIPTGMMPLLYVNDSLTAVSGDGNMFTLRNALQSICYSQSVSLTVDLSGYQYNFSFIVDTPSLNGTFNPNSQSAEVLIPVKHLQAENCGLSLLLSPIQYISGYSARVNGSGVVLAVDAVDMITVATSNGSSTASVIFPLPVVLNVDGLESPKFPTTGSTMTVSGSHFGFKHTAGLLSVEGMDCIFSSMEELVCSLPPGTGKNHRVLVKLASQAAEPFTFSFKPPIITHTKPMFAYCSIPTRLTLFGSNFGRWDDRVDVIVDGYVISVSSVDHTSATVLIPPRAAGCDGTDLRSSMIVSVDAQSVGHSIQYATVSDPSPLFCRRGACTVYFSAPATMNIDQVKLSDATFKCDKTNKFSYKCSVSAGPGVYRTYVHDALGGGWLRTADITFFDVHTSNVIAPLQSATVKVEGILIDSDVTVIQKPSGDRGLVPAYGSFFWTTIRSDTTTVSYSVGDSLLVEDLISVKRLTARTDDVLYSIEEIETAKLIIEVSVEILWEVQLVFDSTPVTCQWHGVRMYTCPFPASGTSAAPVLSLYVSENTLSIPVQGRVEVYSVHTVSENILLTGAITKITLNGEYLPTTSLYCGTDTFTCDFNSSSSVFCEVIFLNSGLVKCLYGTTTVPPLSLEKPLVIDLPTRVPANTRISVYYTVLPVGSTLITNEAPVTTHLPPLTAGDHIVQVCLASSCVDVTIITVVNLTISLDEPIINVAESLLVRIIVEHQSLFFGQFGKDIGSANILFESMSAVVRVEPVIADRGVILTLPDSLHAANEYNCTLIFDNGLHSDPARLRVVVPYSPLCDPQSIPANVRKQVPGAGVVSSSDTSRCIASPRYDTDDVVTLSVHNKHVLGVLVTFFDACGDSTFGVLGKQAVEPICTQIPSFGITHQICFMDIDTVREDIHVSQFNTCIGVTAVDAVGYSLDEMVSLSLVTDEKYVPYPRSALTISITPLNSIGAVLETQHSAKVISMNEVRDVTVAGTTTIVLAVHKRGLLCIYVGIASIESIVCVSVLEGPPVSFCDNDILFESPLTVDLDLYVMIPSFCDAIGASVDETCSIDCISNDINCTNSNGKLHMKGAVLNGTDFVAVSPNCSFFSDSIKFQVHKPVLNSIEIISLQLSPQKNGHTTLIFSDTLHEMMHREIAVNYTVFQQGVHISNTEFHISHNTGFVLPPTNVAHGTLLVICFTHRSDAGIVETCRNSTVKCDENEIWSRNVCLCAAGFTLVDNVCKPCGMGSFKSELTNPSCSPCPPTMTSLIGARSADQCHCPNGTSWDKAASACYLCHRGYMCFNGSIQAVRTGFYLVEGDVVPSECSSMQCTTISASVSTKCSNGSLGLLCNMCEDGYVRNRRTSCVESFANTDWQTSLIVIAGVMITALTMSIWPGSSVYLVSLFASWKLAYVTVFRNWIFQVASLSIAYESLTSFPIVVIEVVLFISLMFMRLGKLKKLMYIKHVLILLVLDFCFFSGLSTPSLRNFSLTFTSSAPMHSAVGVIFVLLLKVSHENNFVKHTFISSVLCALVFSFHPSLMTAVSFLMFVSLILHSSLHTQRLILHIIGIFIYLLYI
ncbi:hypothetical protein PCE1_003543 [Barthelona sp. PCE]